MRPTKGSLPLYLQLREAVRAKIESGEYMPGTPIPSEKQFADAYGMHRLSVRIALNGLIREGLLKSIQGKGVYVCGPKKQETTYGIQPGPEELKTIEGSRVLIKAVREAGPYYSSLLSLAPEDPVWYIRRILSQNGEPVALKDTIIPCDKLPSLEEIDLQLFSLYDALNWSSIHLYSGDQVLQTTYLDPAMARLLNLSPKQAVMEISCIVRSPDEEPAAYSCCYIRSDKAEYLLHRQSHNSSYINE